MTAEEVKTMREEVEHRYCVEKWEQDINEMTDLYKKMKECLPVSEDRVANNILDYGCWDEIDYILSQMENHQEWKEVFSDEIVRLERNREYFVKRHHELTLTEKEHRLSWWNRLFRKDSNPNSTNNKEN